MCSIRARSADLGGQAISLKPVEYSSKRSIRVREIGRPVKCFAVYSCILQWAHRPKSTELADGNPLWQTRCTPRHLSLTAVVLFEFMNSQFTHDMAPRGNTSACSASEGVPPYVWLQRCDHGHPWADTQQFSSAYPPLKKCFIQERQYVSVVMWWCTVLMEKRNRHLGRVGEDLAQCSPATWYGNFHHLSQPQKNGKFERQQPVGILENDLSFLLKGEVNQSDCGAVIVQRLELSPPTKASRVRSPAVSLQCFRKWESCETTPLAGGLIFFRGSPIFPALALQHCSILTSLVLRCLSRLLCSEPPVPPLSAVLWYHHLVRGFDREVWRTGWSAKGGSWGGEAQLCSPPPFGEAIYPHHLPFRHTAVDMCLRRDEICRPAGKCAMEPRFGQIVFFTNEASFTRYSIVSLDFQHLCGQMKTFAIASFASTKSTIRLRHVGSTLGSHQCESGSIPGRVTGFSQVGIVPDDAVGLWVFSGISRPPPLHSSATPYSLQSPSSALKTSLLTAARVSSFTHSLLIFGTYAVRYLNLRFGQRWAGRGEPIVWPARSPELTDRSAWGHMKGLVHETSVESEENLVVCVLSAAYSIH
ncbi:hypothetical protein PR048_010391 [Dryococelus australis]|uniref:Uncharacterized protein n=1 Tax=Dryococelus australis TaxID=614101 RepID=A0ABQ9I2J8_9NEOP|nr:hypothetical protein PR048_010391 [Dryococelus australis]